MRQRRQVNHRRVSLIAKVSEGRTVSVFHLDAPPFSQNFPLPSYYSTFGQILQPFSIFFKNELFEKIIYCYTYFTRGEENAVKHKKLLIFLLLLAIALLSVSCKQAVRDPYAFSKDPFFAVLDGNYNGVPYACEASFSDRTLLRVSFSAPESLAGTVLLLEEDGRYRISQGKITYVTEETDAFCSLLLVRDLLCPKSFTPLSVERIGDMTSFSLRLDRLSEPVTLISDRDGLPTQISGSNFSFLVRISPIPAPEPRES
jgi:hypothetical protein